MTGLAPRLKTIMVSINPTTKSPAWHGCPTALGVLRGINPAIAVWRPYPGTNNIREIALHIAFWENSVANRVGETNALAGFKQRKTGWALMQDTLDAKEWKNELNLIKAAHGRLLEAVMNVDPDLLDQPVGKSANRTVADIRHGVAEHSLYHTAQIEMIKTLASKNGVK